MSDVNQCRNGAGENSTDFKSVLVAMNYIVDINERALLKDAYCRS